MKGRLKVLEPVPAPASPPVAALVPVPVCPSSPASRPARWGSWPGATNNDCAGTVGNDASKGGVVGGDLGDAGEAGDVEPGRGETIGLAASSGESIGILAAGPNVGWECTLEPDPGACDRDDLIIVLLLCSPPGPPGATSPDLGANPLAARRLLPPLPVLLPARERESTCRAPALSGVAIGAEIELPPLPDC